jgi:hypothetical protein
MKNVNHHASKKWLQDGDAQPLAEAIPLAIGDLDSPGPDPPSYWSSANGDDKEDGGGEEDGSGEDPNEAVDK